MEAGNWSKELKLQRRLVAEGLCRGTSLALVAAPVFTRRCGPDHGRVSSQNVSHVYCC